MGQDSMVINLPEMNGWNKWYEMRANKSIKLTLSVLFLFVIMFNVDIAFSKEAEKPTDEEIQIYCASQEDLFKIHPNDSEKISDKRICQKFGITKERLNEIYIKVVTYTKGKNPCNF